MCSLSPSARPSTVRILAPVALHREHQAGAHRLAVQHDRAGAAHAVLATNMRAGLAAIVANDVDQGTAGLDLNGMIRTIDIEGDPGFGGHARIPPDGAKDADFETRKAA